MKYREALKIGNRADGAVKCTYATIYDKDQKPLFSLQKESTKKLINWQGGDWNENMTWADATIIDINKGFYLYDGGSRYGGENIGIHVNLPVVVAKGLSNDRLVPAYIYDDARDLILAYIKETKKVSKFVVYRVYDINTPGNRAGSKTIVLSTYSYQDEAEWRQQDTDNYHHKIVVEHVTNPRWERLAQVLTSGEPIYIKPGAFEWNATDIQNATITDEQGVEINLQDYVSEAAERLNKAKAALAIAGVATVI